MKLSNDEKTYLKERIQKDEDLLEFFQKIIMKRGGDIRTLALDSNNWAIKRAYKDGQLRELDWLTQFLKQE
jgi:hypothetical protein